MPIRSLLKRQTKNDEPEDLEAEELEPVEPEPSGPSLFLMAPSPGAANAFCLLKFRSAEDANEFAVQELPPSSGVNQIYGFWGLHGSSGGNGDGPSGEALVLIRDAVDANLVHPVSFVDFNSAFDFLRYEIRHGLNPSLVLLYWAALVTIKRRQDGSLTIDCEQPAVNGAVSAAPVAEAPVAAPPVEQVQSYPGDEEKEMAVAAAQDIVRIAEPPAVEEEKLPGPPAETASTDPPPEPETVSGEVSSATAGLEPPAAPQVEPEARPLAEAPPIVEEPPAAAEVGLQADEQPAAEPIPIVDELPDVAAESETLTESPIEEKEVAEAQPVAAEESPVDTEPGVAEPEAEDGPAAGVQSVSGDEESVADLVLPAVFDDVQPEDVSVLGGADEGPGSGGWSGPDALQADLSSLENSAPAAPEGILSLAGDEEMAPYPETSRPLRPAAVAEWPLEPPRAAIGEMGEEVEIEVDLAVEAQKLLKVRRWQTKEEPFKGFDSPPGKF